MGRRRPTRFPRPLPRGRVHRRAFPEGGSTRTIGRHALEADHFWHRPPTSSDHRNAQSPPTGRRRAGSRARLVFRTIQPFVYVPWTRRLQYSPGFGDTKVSSRRATVNLNLRFAGCFRPLALPADALTSPGHFGATISSW